MKNGLLIQLTFIQLRTSRAILLQSYYDFDAARLDMFEYIESWYNRKRIHSSIGYMTLQQLEDEIRKTA